MNALLAWFWLLAHFALVLLLVAGGPLGVAWPRRARAHLVAAVATGAVFLTGADCPLTVWEKSAREGAGWSVYDGGFVEHYLVNPLHAGGITTGVTLAIVAAWVVPSVIGHTLRWRRRRAQASEMSSKVVAAATPMGGPAASAH